MTASTAREPRMAARISRATRNSHVVPKLTRRVMTCPEGMRMVSSSHTDFHSSTSRHSGSWATSRGWVRL